MRAPRREHAIARKKPKKNPTTRAGANLNSIDFATLDFETGASLLREQLKTDRDARSHDVRRSEEEWWARVGPEAGAAIGDAYGKLLNEKIDHIATKKALYPMADRAKALATSHRGGRKRGAVNELTRVVVKYLKQHPEASADDVLEHLKQCGKEVHQVVQEVIEVGLDHRIDWVTKEGKEKFTLWSTIEKKIGSLRPRP